VKLSDVAIEVRAEAFARDLIDVAYANEPWVTRILDAGSAEIFLPGAAIVPDFQYAYLLFGARLLGPDREVGRRFLRAYVRAVDRYSDEGKSPRLVEALAARTHLDRDLLRRACWPPTTRGGHVDRASLERYQTWALKEGLLDARVDLDRLIDDGLLPEAAGADVPAP
jgi:NitT/TauT family transport system substrate-binding protein